MIKSIFFGLLALPLVSFSQLEYIASPMDLSKVGTIEVSRCIDCEAIATPTPTSSPTPVAEPLPTFKDKKCKKKYDRLYADGTVNITVAWGYGDSEGSLDDDVWSEYWGNLAIEKLMSKCPMKYGLDKLTPADEQKEDFKTSCGEEKEYNKSCGFEYSPDGKYLIKDITDHNGKVSHVKIQVLKAPLSESDSSNRASVDQFIRDRVCTETIEYKLVQCLANNTASTLNEDVVAEKCEPGDEEIYQPCRSLHVQKKWENAIANKDGNNDEIVMYNGHARDGGGPSFGIPRVLENGHVDYPWYRKNRPGHMKERAAFQKATARGKRPPVFYASHSCNSKLHFFTKGVFPEISPSTAFILSKRTAFTDEMVISQLQILENAFTFKCGKEFSDNIKGASCAYNINNF